MFYLLKLIKEVELHPKFFGPNLRETLKNKLTAEVEGTVSGKYGFVAAVPDVEKYGQGKIREGTGFATFDVTYFCIVMRPLKGEVMDCVVTSVNKVGFFAEAGPVQIFVSNHLIPEDFDFNAMEDSQFVTTDESIRIRQGTEVRVRIVGTRIDATEMFCVATIKEDFLGVVGDPT
ncbi:hypothetical protein WJX84_009200 [Apatococcus fuscideae]|uniref:DNA-directed RNA polymerase II subunit RPB7 n=1 Tax=Apatococcus fuscideae TaxID=2026836 RepID=A0AAW1SZQ0_9CHLO